MRLVTRSVGVVLLATVAGLVSPAVGLGQSRPAGLPAWSPATVVDRVAPTTQGLSMNDVSCPSARLCVAVDSQGQVLTASSPIRSAQWRAVQLSVPRNPSVEKPEQFGLRRVSCPSIHLCVALGGGSYVFVSRDPTGQASAWKTIRLGGGGGFSDLRSLTCASIDLCVAMERGGVVFVSTNPAGGAKAWHLRQVVPRGSFDLLADISCPTAHFCAALSNVSGYYQGLVFTTTHPLRPSASWHAHSVGQLPWEISCSSARLCVVADLDGPIYTSTSPAAGRWRRDGRIPGAPEDLTCHSVTLCVALESSTAFISRDPGAATGVWHAATLPGTGATSVSCPSGQRCIGVTRQGEAFTTSAPENGPWNEYVADGANGFTGVSCPVASLCVATDDAGDILRSADPGGPLSAWRGSRVDPGTGLTGISCPARNLCVAVDHSGGLLSSTDPAGSTVAWSRAEIAGIGSLHDVSCPSRSLCLALGDAGTLFTSTAPAGGATAWTAAFIEPAGGGATAPALRSVTCASPTFCLVVDGSGHVFTSTDPAGGALAWQESDLPPDEDFSPHASCPSSQLCVVSEATIWASMDPAGGTATWGSQSPPKTAWRAVGCSSTTMCLLSKRDYSAPSSNFVGSTDPAGGPTAWHYDGSDNLGVVVSLSCQRGTTTCVAVDSEGAILHSH